MFRRAGISVFLCITFINATMAEACGIWWHHWWCRCCARVSSGSTYRSQSSPGYSASPQQFIDINTLGTLFEIAERWADRRRGTGEGQGDGRGSGCPDQSERFTRIEQRIQDLESRIVNNATNQEKLGNLIEERFTKLNQRLDEMPKASVLEEIKTNVTAIASRLSPGQELKKLKNDTTRYFKTESDVPNGTLAGTWPKNKAVVVVAKSGDKVQVRPWDGVDTYWVLATDLADL